MASDSCPRVNAIHLDSCSRFRVSPGKFTASAGAHIHLYLEIVSKVLVISIIIALNKSQPCKGIPEAAIIEALLYCFRDLKMAYLNPCPRISEKS